MQQTKLNIFLVYLHTGKDVISHNKLKKNASPGNAAMFGNMERWSGGAVT